MKVLACFLLWKMRGGGLGSIPDSSGNLRKDGRILGLRSILRSLGSAIFEGEVSG